MTLKKSRYKAQDPEVWYRATEGNPKEAEKTPGGIYNRQISLSLDKSPGVRDKAASEGASLGSN